MNMLWKMLYHAPRGVTIDQVEAASLKEAEAIGRAWCEAHSMDHYRFISIIGPVVVAGPELLTHGIARDMFDSAGEEERSEADGSPAARPPDDVRGPVRPRTGPRATA
jgi:hypothetical protein